MVDIGRASRVQGEKEVRSQLDRMEMIEALRHGNIYEVFAKTKAFKVSDFHDFFAGQWRSWKGDLVQDGEIKAMEGSYPEPQIIQFSTHQRGATISKEEGDELARSMSGALAGMAGIGGSFKAISIGGKGIDTGGGAPADGGGASLGDRARSTIDDWNNFMNDSWGQIIDAQMASDYQQKMGEMRAELDRMIAMAKSGAIGPEFLLIALAKVNSTKNGVLMTGLGKKAFHVNESLNRIANDLHTLSPADPRYAGELQMGQSKTREGALQMNLLQTDMTKVMQDVESVMNQVKSTIDEINRTRTSIISKLSGTG